MKRLFHIFIQTLLIAGPVGAGTETASPGRLVESPLSAGNLLETGFGLLVVLGVMLGLAWFVKRFVQVPGMARGKVQVIGGVSLGARERAVLLAVDGKRLLVGVAPGQVTTLMTLSDDLAEPAESFEDQLNAVNDSQRVPEDRP